MVSIRVHNFRNLNFPLAISGSARVLLLLPVMLVMETRGLLLSELISYLQYLLQPNTIHVLELIPIPPNPIASQSKNSVFANHNLVVNSMIGHIFLCTLNKGVVTAEGV